MSFLGKYPFFKKAWIRRFRELGDWDRSRTITELDPKRWQEFLGDEAFTGKSDLVRLAAVKMLDSKRWQEQLASKARDGDEYWREAVVARLRPDKWQDLLADLAENDPSNAVRSLAVRGLDPVRWGDVIRRWSERSSELTARWLTVLQTNADAQDTREAIIELAATRNPSLAPIFAKYVNDQREPRGTNEMFRVCVAAIQGLGSIGDDASVETLVRVLEDEKTTPYDVIVSARALAATRCPRAVVALKRMQRRVPAISQKWGNSRWRYYADAQALSRGLATELKQIDFD